MIKHFPFRAACLLWILTLLTMQTTSCSRAPEQISASPFDLPDRFSLSGDVAASAQWWQNMNDPALVALIEHALSDNFSLLIARDRLAEARASARQAGARLSPILEGDGQGKTLRNYQTDSTKNTLLLELAASYEIDLWGRLAAIRDAAVLNSRATRDDLFTAAISIAAEVAQTWYRIVEAELQLQLMQKQKKTNGRVLELIELRFHAGQSGAPDVLQQRQLVESNNAELADSRRSLQLLNHKLALLLGEFPGSYTAPATPVLPSLPPLPDTGIVLDLLNRRPDIRSSYLLIQAEDRQVAAAIADRLPRLSISANLSTSGNQAGDLFNNWFTTFAANIAGPIIDGGYRKAEVEKRKAKMNRRLNEYGETVLRAIGEVEDALTQEKTEAEILASLKTRLKLAKQTVNHVADRYRMGAEDYQRVLLALISYQGLEQKIIKSKRLSINYRISLYRALGGNFPLDTGQED
ncbi:MAG: efflux transporter outer membrane subunit [Deltaproteobacteria bacterium]|nr:efflux transporter outer membrane subunit [Deltaproteobacteria bacterium]